MSEQSKDICVEYSVHEALMRGFDPVNLTSEQIAHIEGIVGYLNDGQIADYLGISVNQFKKALEEHEVLRNAYNTGKTKYIVACGNLVMDKVVSGKDLNAAMFYLKTKGKWNETQQLEHTVNEPKKLDDFYD